MAVIPGTRSRRAKIVLLIILVLLVGLAVWIGWLAAHTSGYQTV